MKDSVRVLGHSVHPILIVFPLGLLFTSFVFDIVMVSTGDPKWHLVSFWMIASGLIGGLIAAVFGLLDWLSIPKGTRAAAVGLWHGLTNLAVMILFAVSLWMRVDPLRDRQLPSTTAVMLSLVGLLLAAVGGWLGGELVERLGIGVYPDANSNAPSSLAPNAGRGGSGRKASGAV